MIHVTVEVDISRPASEVFAYLEDVARNTSWLKGMRSCRWTSPPPVRVGSMYEQKSHFLGRDIHTSFEVTAHQPGRQITIESRQGSSFPIAVSRIVDPVDGSHCHVTEIVDGDATGFYAVATPLLKRMVLRNIRRDYGSLKRVLEGTEAGRHALDR